MQGGYSIGLTATPNLYSNIYANKQAKADADAAKKAQEQSERYAKDADKFRVDYAKIHPIHAAEAKGTVAEFMQKANELREKYPNTYANTEEYNKAFFDATAKLEDLTGSSKVIYDEQKLRLEHPDKFETNNEVMEALKNVDPVKFASVLGRDRAQYGDIALEKWNEQEAMKNIIANTASDELYKKDAQGNIITTPVGGGTEDVKMTTVKTLRSPQLVKNTLSMYENSPAMQRKFGSPDKAIEWAKGFAEQGEKEIVNAIYHAPAAASYGQGATNEDWTKAATRPTTISYGEKSEQVPSIANFTITETPATFSGGEAIDIKSGGKYTGKVANGTLGQVHIIAVHKDTGLPVTGGEINQGKDKDIEYRPMIVMTTDPMPVTAGSSKKESKSLLVPASVGRGAAESKESAEERAALKERLNWAQNMADKANEGLKTRKPSAATKKFNEMSVSEKQAIVNQIPSDIKSKGSTEVTKWLKDNGY